MILLLDTSDKVCRISLINGGNKFDDEWQSDRDLADGLLKYLESNLKKNGWSWSNISYIGVFEGPGSFTGLRIGLTVANTLASSLGIPIVGAKGDDWQDIILKKIENKEDGQIVMPFYGSEAHITTPRK